MKEQEKKHQGQIERIQTLLTDQRLREKTLDHDLALKSKVIVDLQNQLNDKDRCVESAENRLARQVIVDRNIEKELQDELGRTNGKCIEFQDECDVLNDEFGMLEEENLALRKEITKLRNENKKLSGVAFGIKGGRKVEKTVE
jgi:DNA repair exonuclease SbcCD ATPase subunit